jgi:hypothetical protein
MSVKSRRYYRIGFKLAPTALLSALLFISGASWLSTLQIDQLGFRGLLPAAQAQSTPDADVANYARAVVDIEEQRLAAYEAASDIMAAAGDEKGLLETRLGCQAHKLSDMPDDMPKPDKIDLLTVLVEFCDGARSAAEANDLTPEQFNSITTAHKEDPELAKRIQSAIADL